jgi:translation initiation factor IF-3
MTIKPKDQGPRLNHRIRVREVRLIGSDGGQLGIVETSKALELARREGLDLVEISPTANPPVCKILDFGKFKYEQKKKAQQAKKHQVVSLTKEVQFRPQTDQHDIDFKVKHIQRFLSEGHKVRVFVRFRGREASHADLGYALLKQIIELVGTAGAVELQPKMEGKIMALVMIPAKGAPKPKKEKPPAAVTAPAAAAAPATGQSQAPK